MIDFTETFFKEINNSKEILYESFKQQETEPVQLTGRCAVIARKQKKHIDKLERLIRNAGMKPIILQSEDTKTFSKIEAKCQNLDILVFYQPDTFYHFAAGKEDKKKNKLLGEKGIFISTRWSDENIIPPSKLLDRLFTHIRISDDFKHLHNAKSSRPKKDSSNIKFPEDISKKLEFFEFLQEYDLSNDFKIQLTIVEPKKFHNESIIKNVENLEGEISLKVISEREMKYNEVNTDIQDIRKDIRTVRFTFPSDKSFNSKEIEQMENNLDSIFQNYNNFLYTSEVAILPLI